MNYHSMRGTIFWPTRGCLAPFSHTVDRDPLYSRPCAFKVSYQPILTVASLTVVSDAWTRFDYEYEMPFCGDAQQFRDWIIGSLGVKRATNDAQSYQNFLLDHLKSFKPYHQDIGNIRHFGSAEWPYLEVRFGDHPVLVRANPALRAGAAANPLQVSADCLGQAAVPVAMRTFLRAYDLVRCGYPTEAVLIAVALLDATVQDALTRSMCRLGLDSEAADALLRNTMTRRLATYLDPVLMLVTGRSLRADDSALFDRLSKANRDRNDAIHKGHEISTSDAGECLLVVYDVLDYLRQVLDPDLRLPPRPTFEGNGPSRGSAGWAGGS